MSHSIAVLAASGGAGGRRSTRFSALSTRWASGQPPVTPRRFARPSRWNVTDRIVAKAGIARAATSDQTLSDGGLSTDVHFAI